MEFVETKTGALPKPLDAGPPALYVEKRSGQPLTPDDITPRETTLTALGHFACNGNQPCSDSDPPFAVSPSATRPSSTPDWTGAPFRTTGSTAAHTAQARLKRTWEKSPGWDGQDLKDSQQLRLGANLYRQFNRFEPAQIERVHHPRLIPPVVVELGELAGLIYRSDKWQPGNPRTYIHFMESPPRLVSNVKGTQLYIVGGDYKVTSRGIEG